MSETLRVYTTSKYKRQRQNRGIIKFLWYLVVLSFILIAIAFFGLSRDLYPVEIFIPEVTNFEIFSPQLMQNRLLLANSPLWNLVEPQSSALEIKKLLLDQQRIPLWIVRHLIYDFFYFSVNDLKNYRDYLVIVRLSRIGCVLETLFALSNHVETDWAGGLNLKFIPNQKIFYTRKGRILLICADRQTLIQSITKDTKNLQQTIFSPEFSKDHEKYLAWGTIKLPWESIRVLFPEIKFYIGLTDTQVAIKAETTVKSDPEIPWTLLLTQIASKPILEPLDTTFSCSIDTGVPLKTWIRAFETIPTITNTLTTATSGSISLLDWIKNFTPLVNNEFYFSLDGFYTDEIIPFLPKYCIVASTQPNICGELTQSFENININVFGEGNKILNTANLNEFILPLIGSSQTDLHIQCIENQLLFSTNNNLQSLVTEYLKSQKPSQENNSSLILKIKPEKLISELEEAMIPLKESNLFQFRHPEKLNSLSNKIKLFKELKIKISLDQGKIKALGIANFTNTN